MYSRATRTHTVTALFRLKVSDPNHSLILSLLSPLGLLLFGCDGALRLCISCMLHLCGWLLLNLHKAAIPFITFSTPFLHSISLSLISLFSLTASHFFSSRL
ncbi:hypothetical protein K1719_037947 [Acacia pycnantha]|nr:hypothetical protein K1719_037947 [Acacia pycnantha]